MRQKSWISSIAGDTLLATLHNYYIIQLTEVGNDWS